MKLLKLFTLGLAVFALCALAADRFEVKSVRYYSTSAGEPVVGHITVAGDKLIFVDDTNPEMTFTVERTGVKTTRIDNGRIVLELVQPLTIREAQQSDVMLALPDTRTREEVITWVKVKK